MIHGLSILTNVTVQVFNKRPTSFSKYSSEYQTHTFNGQNCGPSFNKLAFFYPWMLCAKFEIDLRQWFWRRYVTFINFLQFAFIPLWWGGGGGRLGRGDYKERSFGFSRDCHNWGPVSCVTTGISSCWTAISAAEPTFNHL